MSSSDTSDPVAAATSAVIDARGKLVGARFKYYAVERANSVEIVSIDFVNTAAREVHTAERDYDAAVERCVRAYDANGRCKSEAMAAISAAIDDKARRDRAERKPSAYDAMQMLYGAVYRATASAAEAHRIARVKAADLRVGFGKDLYSYSARKYACATANAKHYSLEARPNVLTLLRDAGVIDKPHTPQMIWRS